MKEKPKGTGRSTANDALPHDLVIAIAGAATKEVAQAAIHGAKKLIDKKKAEPEKPRIILTDKE